MIGEDNVVVQLSSVWPEGERATESLPPHAASVIAAIRTAIMRFLTEGDYRCTEVASSPRWLVYNREVESPILLLENACLRIDISPAHLYDNLNR